LYGTLDSAKISISDELSNILTQKKKHQGIVGLRYTASAMTRHFRGSLFTELIYGAFRDVLTAEFHRVKFTE